MATKKDKKEYGTIIHTRVTNSVLKKFDDIAKREKRTRANLLRVILEEYVERASSQD